MPTSVSSEVMSATGLDYVCLDMQHGLIGYVDMVPMLQAMDGPTPVVRVLENTPGHIGKALDAGAMGVIVPMVNSRAECEAAMRAARYAPGGSRSFGPTRAAQVEGPDYFERANADVALLPMIETAAAVADLDGILTVPGVEAIYVGPADLSISLGHGPEGEHPDFLEALDTIVAGCRRHGVVAGIHTSVATARDRLDRGFTMLTIAADLAALRAGIAEDIRRVRGMIARPGLTE